jgi:hypothetical protein
VIVDFHVEYCNKRRKEEVNSTEVSLDLVGRGVVGLLVGRGVVGLLVGRGFVGLLVGQGVVGLLVGRIGANGVVGAGVDVTVGELSTIYCTDDDRRNHVYGRGMLHSTRKPYVHDVTHRLNR